MAQNYKYILMTKQEVIIKVANTLITKLSNELDYYMFEHLGATETNDEYVKEISELAYDVVDYLSENL